MALTARQQRFVDEYLIDLNATKAAIRAGYSEKTAQPASSRLLSSVMISAAINKGLAASTKRLEITVDSITTRLSVIADSAQSMGLPAGLSVARQAVMDIAKLNGLVVDSSEVITRSPEERAARLVALRAERERLARTH